MSTESKENSSSRILLEDGEGRSLAIDKETIQQSKSWLETGIQEKMKQLQETKKRPLQDQTQNDLSSKKKIMAMVSDVAGGDAPVMTVNYSQEDLGSATVTAKHVRQQVKQEVKEVNQAVKEEEEEDEWDFEDDDMDAHLASVEIDVPIGPESKYFPK